MRRSISWRASTAREAFSSGKTKLLMECCSSRVTSAENLARLMTRRGLAFRHTSITCTIKSELCHCQKPLGRTFGIERRELRTLDGRPQVCLAGHTDPLATHGGKSCLAAACS